MRQTYRNLFLIQIILLPVWIATAQESNIVHMPVKVSIPTVSLVSFAGSDAHFTTIPGKGAIQKITPSTKDTTWLNYSSVIDDKSTNSISASIISGNLPVEVVVKLNIGEDVGAGAGTMGKPTGIISLNEYPQTVITEIGTCYTGQGSKKGHPISYSWEWLPPYDVDHSSIDDNIEISVIYTLIADK